MKKKIGLITAIVISVIILGSIFFLSVIPRLSDRERDVSWMADVESFIEDVKPSEPIEHWVSIDGARFSLIENGSNQILYHVHYDDKTGETDDNFVTYMMGLVHKINSEVNNSVSNDLFNEILEQNKVLKVDFGTDSREIFWQVNAHTVAWFILEDNLNKNLEGTIIIKQQKIPSGTQELTLREIRK